MDKKTRRKASSKAYYEANREKRLEQMKAWYEANREKKQAWAKAHYKKNREKVKDYYKNNRDRISARKKAHYEANRESYLEKQAKYLKANKGKRKAYERANIDKLNARSARRKAWKIQATPNWLTKEDLGVMQGFYTAARWLRSLAGCALHVDHIIPLQGKEVCGLHVPWNLQLLTEEENLKKGNRYEDDK